MGQRLAPAEELRLCLDASPEKAAGRAVIERPEEDDQVSQGHGDEKRLEANRRECDHGGDAKSDERDFRHVPVSLAKLNAAVDTSCKCQKTWEREEEALEVCHVIFFQSEVV